MLARGEEVNLVRPIRLYVPGGIMCLTHRQHGGFMFIGDLSVYRLG